MNNVEVFYDTQKQIKNNSTLESLTKYAIDSTHIVEEGFVSSKKPYFRNASIRFEESLTLIVANKMVDNSKKTAVLNFANPVNPGGGVWNGASAQEEYLCRASNLYNCLVSKNAVDFYRYHNKLKERNQKKEIFLATDRIVYSPNITVFKEDIGYFPDTDCRPTQEYAKCWRNMDMITCAAPYFSQKNIILPDGDLYHLFYNRIRNILESAIDNQVEALILGAFGCGAFHNPPIVVAQVFQDIFMEDRYKYAFSNVVFVVKRTGYYCENIEAFEAAFLSFPPTGEYVFSAERNKRRFLND